MTHVIFQNLQFSEFLNNIAQSRIDHVLEKFPSLPGAHATVHIRMENSLKHSGQDLYSVKVVVMSGQGHAPIVLDKSDPSAYRALATVTDRLLESLRRFKEKHHFARRRISRQMLA